MDSRSEERPAGTRSFLEHLAGAVPVEILTLIRCLAALHPRAALAALDQIERNDTPPFWKGSVHDT